MRKGCLPVMARDCAKFEATFAFAREKSFVQMFDHVNGFAALDPYFAGGCPNDARPLKLKGAQEERCRSMKRLRM